MPEKPKAGWTRVAFGDVVRLCRERSTDPLEDGFDRYVGLEHLDPGELKIRRWGNTADGTTFTNVFRAGQVLFGKRRAYQRKLAVADYDGVCSGDIYVLESADATRLLPELLPFICQTDRFFEHAVGTSAGSLSPRTNWESLASFEFDMPPLDEQRRIAEVIQDADTSAERLRECEAAALDLYVSLVETLLVFAGSRGGPVNDGRSRNDSRQECLGEIADIRFSNVDKKTDGNEIPVRLCNYMDVYTRDYVTKNIAFMQASATVREIERFSIEKGDVLITKDSEEPTDIGVPALVTDEISGVVCGYHLAILRPHRERLQSEYLWHFLKTRTVKRYFLQMANGITRFGLSTGAIRELPVVLPCIEVQRQIAEQLSRCWDALEVLRQRTAVASSLKQRLITILT